MQGHEHLREELSSLKNMPIFSFSDPILLRGLRTCGLMNKAMLLEIGMKVVIIIFATIVGAENPDLGGKLSLNHNMK